MKLRGNSAAQRGSGCCNGETPSQGTEESCQGWLEEGTARTAFDRRARSPRYRRVGLEPKQFLISSTNTPQLSSLKLIKSNEAVYSIMRKYSSRHLVCVRNIRSSAPRKVWVYHACRMNPRLSLGFFPPISMENSIYVVSLDCIVLQRI